MKMRTKKCPRCKQEKPLEEGFYKDKRTKDGKTRTCKECRLAVSRTKESKEKAAAWRKAHPENAVKWKKDHPKRAKEMRVKSYQTRKVKILADAKARCAENRARAIQLLGGKCYLCGSTHETNRNRLHAPHIIPRIISKRPPIPWGGKWERIERELKHCFLICAKCHDAADAPLRGHTGYTELARQRGLKPDTFRSRIERGWTLEGALSAPIMSRAEVNRVANAARWPTRKAA